MGWWAFAEENETDYINYLQNYKDVIEAKKLDLFVTVIDFHI